MRTVRLELDLDVTEALDNDALLGRFALVSRFMAITLTREGHPASVRAAAIGTTSIEGPPSA